jgi:hypothetical protein
VLFTEVSEEHRFDLQDPSGIKKEELKNTLRELVSRKAQSLKTREEQNLTQELRKRLPHVLPQECYFNLCKLDNHGSYLSPSVGVAWCGPSGELQGEDLVEFKTLICGANRKFEEARKREITETFLILLEIGFSGAEADIIQNTLQSVACFDYCFIEYCYFHGGRVLSSSGDSNPLLCQIDLPR